MHDGSTDILYGQWQQWRGQAKVRWNELTDDDLDAVEGKRDILVGKLRERYGWEQMRAEGEVDNFIKENQGTPVPQMAGQNSPGQGPVQGAKQGQGQGKGNGSY